MTHGLIWNRLHVTLNDTLLRNLSLNEIQETCYMRATRSYRRILMVHEVDFWKKRLKTKFQHKYLLNLVQLLKKLSTCKPFVNVLDSGIFMGVHCSGYTLKTENRA